MKIHIYGWSIRRPAALRVVDTRRLRQAHDAVGAEVPAYFGRLSAGQTPFGTAHPRPMAPTVDKEQAESAAVSVEPLLASAVRLGAVGPGTGRPPGPDAGMGSGVVLPGYFGSRSNRALDQR